MFVCMFCECNQFAATWVYNINHDSQDETSYWTVICSECCNSFDGMRYHLVPQVTHSGCLPNNERFLGLFGCRPKNQVRLLPYILMYVKRANSTIMLLTDVVSLREWLRSEQFPRMQACVSLPHHTVTGKLSVVPSSLPMRPTEYQLRPLIHIYKTHYPYRCIYRFWVNFNIDKLDVAW